MTIDAAELLGLDRKEMLGFLLAQKYEVGNPKSVNALFTDLLGVTPFAAKERERYERLIDDRNLLVHHGGIYKSGGKIRSAVKEGVRVFYDSVRIPRSDFGASAFFVEGMVRKTVEVTEKALQEFISDHKIVLEEERRDVLQWVGSILKRGRIVELADFVD